MAAAVATGGLVGLSVVIGGIGGPACAFSERFGIESPLGDEDEGGEGKREAPPEADW